MKSQTSSPAVQTSTSTASFPDELKPYITDILERAKVRAEAKDTAGYQAYTGPRIAEFDPATVQAQEGITGLVGASQPYMDAATGLVASSAGQFTPAAAQQYMSPYMQAVVDIEKREGDRDFNQLQQAGAAQDVAAGGFGGSRTGLREALDNRTFLERQGDIQTKGLQSAFQTAAQQFEAQKMREAQAGQGMASLGQQIPAQQLAEFQGLASVGEQKQGQAQNALDLAYQQFLAEQSHPDRTLQEYQSIIRGFPLDPSMSRETSTPTSSPSLMGQVAGAGMTAAGIYNAFKNEGGLVGRVKGGTVGLNTGSSVADANQMSIDVIVDQLSKTQGAEKKKWLDALKAKQAKSSQRMAAEEAATKRQQWMDLAGAGMQMMGNKGDFLTAVSEVGPDALAKWGASEKELSGLEGKYEDLALDDMKAMAGIEAGEEAAAFEAAKAWQDYQGDLSTAGSFKLSPISQGDVDSIAKKAVRANILSETSNAQVINRLAAESMREAAAGSSSNNDYHTRFQEIFTSKLGAAGLGEDAGSGVTPKKKGITAGSVTPKPKKPKPTI